jgi:uroporphyrinogen III methyltransferase/synthase
MGTRGVVLNSRPRDQAAELSRLLAAAGFEVLEAAAIETVPAWEPSALRQVRRDLVAGLWDWVVLPSQNAGRQLVQELKHARVVCGTSSARALGLTPTVTLDRFSASAALEVLRPLVRPGQRILVPRAAAGDDALTDGLVTLGVHVHAPIAYRTVAVDPSSLVEAEARLCNREVIAVTVCSPSAIQSLVATFGRDLLLMSKLICLGETTAHAACEANLRVDAVASRTTMVALVEAVLTALELEVPA